MAEAKGANPAAARWTARGVLKLAAIVAVTLPLIPAQAALAAVGPRYGGLIPPLFHRFLCRVLGVRVRVHGAPPPKGASALIAANHVSWLDIPVVTSQGHASFVAKSEIAGWPGVGILARLQRTIFIDRSRRTHTGEVAGAMGERIGRGERIVLFPEGTTGDGTRVLPFRSSLFGAVKEALGDGEDEEGSWSSP